MRKLTALIAAIAAFTLLAATFAISPANAQGARITLIHGIPDIEVEVEVGGEVIIEDFAFGDRQDLSAFAGETLTDLKVLVAGTDAVAIDQGDTALPAEGNFTAIAHLDPEGEPMLTIFENDTSAIDAGDGRLTVRHTAAADPVDIKLDGVVVINGISSTKEASADLRAKQMVIEVTPKGEDDVIIGPADIDVVEGESIVIYAVGGTDGDATVLTETISLGSIDDGDAMDDGDDADADADAMDDDAEDDDAEAMDDGDDEDTAMNSAPAGVETGNSPITSKSFPLVAVALGIIALSLGGLFTLRRNDLLS